MKAVSNVFKVLGVFPFNRSGNFREFDPQSLTEKTGLAYIPLYSPARVPITRVHGKPIIYFRPTLINFEEMP